MALQLLPPVRGGPPDTGGRWRFTRWTWPALGLRGRLMLLVTLAMVLPGLLLTGRFVLENAAENAQALASLQVAVANVAADLEHRVQGTAQLHYGLAYSRLLDDPDRAACSAYLAAVREQYPQYTGIITVKPDGQLHCDSLQSGRSLDLRDRSYFRRGSQPGAGLITEPVFGRLTGNSVLQIVFPARDDHGSLRFLMVASLNLKQFAESQQRQVMLPQAELLLIDDKGTVMAHAGASHERHAPGTPLGDPGLLRLARTGGSAEQVLPDGSREVWAVARSPALQAAGLHVLLGQPHQALVAVAAKRLRQGMVVLFGAGLLLFAGVWLLSEWGIRRQVGRISAMVGELGSGHLGARITGPHPRGELGELMQALNGAAASLQEQRAAIDALDAQLRAAHQRELLDRQENEARLARIANYDGLTGLPNRNQFRERLQQALARRRRTGRPFALFFLDVDRFKTINDSLGHDVGDGLLVQVARVLSTCIRDTDTLQPPGQQGGEVFRLGGDEFTILTEDVATPEAAATIARRMLQALDRSFQIGDQQLFISASIGITLCTAEGSDADGLLKQADIAMYRSKEAGRATYCFFDQAMHDAAAERQQLETRLRQALARNEFSLHYQPQAGMAGDAVTAVEALLRWQPATGAALGPDRFIPVLEDLGLIVAVGEWVMMQACRQARAWRDAGLPPIRMAVNLSPRQLRLPDLSQRVQAILQQSGLAPNVLEVELTESMLIDESPAVTANLSALGAMGVKIAIDDFGTGHSALRYLKRFDVDTLKLDRSFVKDTPGDPEDSAIATAVVALGHGLGLRVVAEGVETPAQREFLQAIGCDDYQGWLLARPMRPEACAAWLAHRGTLPRAEVGQGMATPA